MSIAARVVDGWRTGIGDARSAWKPAWSFCAVAVALLALLPFVWTGRPVTVVSAILFAAVAVIGLNIAVGIAGVPSIGHGAFMATGALCVALLESKLGWSWPIATAAAIAASVGAGIVVGVGAVRLRPEYLAISSWIGAWLFVTAMHAFPDVSGGAAGIPVGRASMSLLGIDFDLTPSWNFEIGVVLLGISALVFTSMRSGALGLALSAWRSNPAAARAIGMARFDQRLLAFTVSAAIAGAAGAFGVRVAGIFDAQSYGPLVSVVLFVAVVVGGIGRLLGPIVVIAILALFTQVGPSAAVLPPGIARFGELGVGALLLGGAAIGGLRPAPRRRRRNQIAPTSSPELTPPRTTELAATYVTKSFGGVTAIDSVSFTAIPGTVHALIGPNGSGKSTLLRVLAGETMVNGGHIRLEGTDVTTADVRERVMAGIVRMPQRPSVFPDLRVAEHIEAALLTRRKHAGFVRDLLRTPRSRHEDKADAEKALVALADIGLGDRASLPARALTGGEQRLLMVAMAIASQPSVVLLDEPATAMDRHQRDVLRTLLRRLAREGVAIVVVEHNLRFLRDVAGEVTALDAGKVVTRGSPADVLSHPGVTQAFLGSTTETS